ncbi:unnamed protein product [Rhizoctonia solani]|uniref:Uncharacterized protein n=1 Tax=Rhizoctonia solani TaxID=456999 RepID=A0A8H3AHL5_9AGAM|nr:unnamed protein product [Rhizoctonia solani]
MSPPSSTPKPNKGFRRLLEPFNLSQPLPLQSSSQPTPGMPAIATTTSRDTGSAEHPILELPLIDNDATVARLSGPAPNLIDVGQEISPEAVIAADRTPVILPTKSLSSPTIGPFEIPLTRDHVTICSGSDPMTATSPVQTKRGPNTAWNGLRESLQSFKRLSNEISFLSAVIGSLLSCLDGLELAAQNYPDFEGMATELTIIIQSLEQYTDGSSLILMSDSTTRIFMAIKKQVNEIGERMRQGSTGNTQGSQLDEDLVNHYRQIQSHFRRLKIGASLSAGSIEDESLMVREY